jgi:hypothetical protein
MALYYDILVYLFRQIYESVHTEFIKVNTALDGSFYHYRNPWYTSAQVCKLWNKACIAAGLVGRNYDFPILKVYKKDNMLIENINKYQMVIYNNDKNDKNSICAGICAGIINNKTCYIRVNNHIRDTVVISWYGEVPKDSLSITQIISICARLRATFGDQSYIARQLIYWPDKYILSSVEYDLFKAELRAWLSTIKICGKAFVVA